MGPEIFRFDALVRTIRDAIGCRTPIVHVPARVALAVAQGIGRLVGDVLLTRDELAGLRANLLVSATPPTAPTRFGDWLTQAAGSLGRKYASEVARHFEKPAHAPFSGQIR